jgi:hypothetical protein
VTTGCRRIKGCLRICFDAPRRKTASAPICSESTEILQTASKDILPDLRDIAISPTEKEYNQRDIRLAAKSTRRHKNDESRLFVDFRTTIRCFLESDNISCITLYSSATKPGFLWPANLPGAA